MEQKVSGKFLCDHNLYVRKIGDIVILVIECVTSNYSSPSMYRNFKIVFNGGVC